MAQLTQLPDDVDLSFVAGDTFRIRVRVIDPSDGDPLPLTEYEFRADIVKDPDRTFVASFDVAIDTESAVPNTAVILTLPPSDTTILPGMGDGRTFKGLWDLEVTFPNDDVRTVAKGSVNCYLDITNQP